MPDGAYTTQNGRDPPQLGNHARAAGVPLAFLALLLLGDPVSALQRGLPIAGLLGLAIFGGGLLLGVAMIAVPSRVAEALGRIDVPATSGGLWGTSVVTLSLLLVFGLALVGPVAIIEALAYGQVADIADLAPRTPSAGALLFGAAFNAFVFLGAPAVYFRYADEYDLPGLLDELGVDVDPKTVPLGLVWAGITLLLALGLAALLAALGLPERGVVSGALFQTIGIPVFLVVNTVAAVGEEIFFRGFLQPRIGLIPQAIWFGIAHATFLSIPHILATVVVGLALGWAYRRHENLVVPVVAHFAYNLTLFLLFLG